MLWFIFYRFVCGSFLCSHGDFDRSVFLKSSSWVQKSPFSYTIVSFWSLFKTIKCKICGFSLFLTYICTTRAHLNPFTVACRSEPAKRKTQTHINAVHPRHTRSPRWAWGASRTDWASLKSKQRKKINLIFNDHPILLLLEVQKLAHTEYHCLGWCEGKDHETKPVALH